MKEEMKDRLRDFATSYEEGAWEDFEQFRKKKKRSFIPLWIRVAAGLLLFIGTGLGLLNHFYRPAVMAVKKTPGNSVAADQETEQRPVAVPGETAPVNKPGHLYRKRPVPVDAHAETNTEAPYRAEEWKAEVTWPGRVKGPEIPLLSVRLKKPVMPLTFPGEKEQEDNDRRELPYLSLALAGSSHQAGGSEPAQNYGIRGTAEFPLGRQMELSTGLALGREALHLRTNLRPMSGIPALTGTDYRWVNMELPVNIRYYLLQKSSVSLSAQAGVSLMGAWGQTSRQYFENHRTIVQLSVGANGEVKEQSYQVTENTVRENTTQAARISLGTAFNLSGGLHYPLGRNSLAIEPFFRYPLGAFTRGHLHFSTVGLQLRWSAGSYRRK